MLYWKILQFYMILMKVILSGAENGGNTCAANGVTVHRLGKSRFYVLHNPKDKNFKFSFDKARKTCKEHGMRLAKVSRVTTDAMVSRLLEESVKSNKWSDTWYWIDAKYNKAINKYTHIDEPKKPINYSNFFFRHPRPVGVGGHIDWHDVYNRYKHVDQCIAIALPYPYPGENYGFQTSWDERACESSTKRRALCENTNPQCNYQTDNPEYFVDSDRIERYFTEGNFVFANRRFIVNWKPRSQEEAKAYCEKHGLQLFFPGVGDNCLIPYLKLWAQPISTYHFWSPLNYKLGQGYFLGSTKVADVDMKFIEGTRSNKFDKQFCVTTHWTYEYPNQTACQGCTWNGVTLTPSNCFNPAGTICRHPDRKQPCNWKPSYTKDKMVAVEETAVVPFGNDFANVWRSTYKQTFGNRLCGSDDREMVDTKWRLKMTQADIMFSYDLAETYWIVDENGFANVGKPETLCTVGTFERQGENYVLITQKESCIEWHFYLCRQS